ncbi:MAG: oligopeptidase PepB [Clostridia bacterium BRH_c25]|nr:MAG: oligopeptidase PepB [Clostridia bacterium BRH_c25]
MLQKDSGIPKRNEIPQEHKWRLEDIYTSNELWEKDFLKIKEMADKLSPYKEIMGDSAAKLLECLNLSTEMTRLFEKVYVYAHMRSHEDSTNSFYQGLADRVDSLGVTVNSANAFIIPGILAMPDEKLNGYLKESEGLSFYGRYLDEIRRVKPHVLNAGEEHLLAMTGEMAQAPGTIFNMLNNADIKFPHIKDENGKEVELTKGRYIQLMESSDRRVRKDAFNGLYSTYSKQKNTLAALLNANVKANIFSSRVRKYASAREQSLFDDNVPVAVYDNLIDAIHDNLELMYRYVRLRKKMMGLDELHMYDLYVPMVKEVKMDIPYEEARDIVKEGLELLGKDYIRDLEKGFNSSWIDVYENEGKRSGAYSWGCYDSHPYVLLNHTDTLNNMFTLAHEMGHALHSYYSDDNQPYIYAQYKIFVAEVASTLNEALVMNHLLKITDDKMKKMYLLNYFMEQFRTTVYRQTMFAEFEKIIHEKAEAGEALTAELLCSIYRDLNIKYYGPDMVLDDYIDMEWARIPHFYTSFYVYKYATGFSAAVSISQQILKEGQPAVDRYLKFLKSGGSDYPIELLKIANVDMATTEPVNNALKLFGSLLDQMEELLGK